ncbi:MAG: cysteine peptidase family C39 domain-containing protein [Prevotella pectinovora]|nr:cysteine peptidase family C39 domain-containing protein [Prevotella pectinovora]
MKRFPFIKQKDSMQCGVACLASICEYYGKELWKAIFAHNSFYFYMTPPTPIGYNQNTRYYGCCSYSPQLFIAIFFFPIFEFQI